MTWEEAELAAFSGARIRRAGWRDRWLRFDVALWFLIPVRPGSLADGIPHVVWYSDFTAAEFGAIDWTTAPLDHVGSYAPVELLIESLGPQDDDLRIKIDGVTVSDTRLNVAWYQGETIRGAFNQHGGWATSGFRTIRIRNEDIAFAMDVGSLVTVDVFDGWGDGWRTSPWTATVRWPDERTTSASGGSIRSGTSPVPSTGAGNYFTTGPHFEHYIENGGFTVEAP
jgi:hypothetical protein